MGDTVRIDLLGPPRVSVYGTPIDVDTRKAIALIAYLATIGEGRRRDSLAGLLWPDYDQAHARAALRRTLSVLNKALSGKGLIADRSTIALAREEVELDIEIFRALTKGCADHAPRPHARCASCRRDLRRAVSSYRDDFMAGFALRDCPEFDDWVFFEAEALRRELVDALRQLVRMSIEEGDYDDAIAHVRRWLRLDPLHEPAHRQLMELYARSDRRSAALRQYRDCVALLDRELGVAPLEETTGLYRVIREGRLVPARADRHEPRSPGPAPPISIHPLPFVGRDAELATMARDYGSVGPAGRFIAVEGEAGVGKTRLVEEFLSTAAVSAAVITARCREDERDLPFGVVSEALREALLIDEGRWLERVSDLWLTEASRVVPELVGDEAQDRRPADGGPGARARFLEGLAHVLVAPLLGSTSGVLFVDDLQWIDDSSMEVLAYTIGRLRRWPICVVGTWRPQEPASKQVFRRLLTESRRTRAATTVRLHRLSRGEVARVVALSPARDSAQDLSSRLYVETEGLPFFVAEYLAALEERSGDEWSLPQGARDVVLARLTSVSENGQQLLSAAAVLGRSFEIETLRWVSGRSDAECVAGVEELARRGLVQEAPGDGAEGESTYDFTHDKLRSVVYEETTLARRRLLHRRAAEVLERRARRQRNEVAAMVANHLLLAGDNRGAADHFRRAGERARTMLANSEALTHFQTALALGHPDGAALHEAIGDLSALNGSFSSAIASYEAATARAPAATVARLAHKIGSIQQRLGEWDAAESHYVESLSLLGDEQPGRQAGVMADRSLNAHRAGRKEDAARFAREVLTLAERAGDGRSLAQAHNILGVLANASRDLASARAHLEISVELAEEVDEPGARVAALNNLALTRRAQGHVGEARTLAEEALKLCIAQGDRHREAALHNNVADILHSAGEEEESMAHLKRAVTLFADIGEPENPQPEIWKLFEW